MLRGSALLDVVHALDAAQYVTRTRDGFEPPARYRSLQELLRAAAADTPARFPMGKGEVPQLAVLSESDHDQRIGTREAASMLGCTPRTVRNLITSEVLLSARTVGGRLSLQRSEVEAESRRRAEARALKEDRRAG